MGLVAFTERWWFHFECTHGFCMSLHTINRLTECFLAILQSVFHHFKFPCYFPHPQASVTGSPLSTRPLKSSHWWHGETKEGSRLQRLQWKMAKSKQAWAVWVNQGQLEHILLHVPIWDGYSKGTDSKCWPIPCQVSLCQTLGNWFSSVISNKKDQFESRSTSLVWSVRSHAPTSSAPRLFFQILGHVLTGLDAKRCRNLSDIRGSHGLIVFTEHCLFHFERMVFACLCTL